jgi:hypothetical protein
MKHRSTLKKHAKNRTNKMPHNICGNVVKDIEGWKVLKIYGGAYERGFAHGYLLRNELERLTQILPFVVKEDIKITFEQFLSTNDKIIVPIVKNKFPEYYSEIKGISDGAKKSGLDISVNYLISWNAYMSLYSLFKDGAREKCSAFIATGGATERGKIVMAHNSHTDFSSGSLFNIVLYVYPKKGHSFVMQTAPGLICSTTDWFICSSGIVGCETTIANINYKPKFGYPYFCRIRKAMQYGNTLDDYTKIMLFKNAGDYACSWLFGNIHTNEIMLFEIGLNIHNIQRTTDGVFYGMNSAFDCNLRENETNDKDFLNIQNTSGSRNVRLNYLLNSKFFGKINEKTAIEIISDHHDVFLNKNIMNARSICKHSELDKNNKRGAYYPFGNVDGKVLTTEMAKKMAFIGRWGSSCDRVFIVADFIKKHPQYKHWKNYLVDFPDNKWVEISV